MLKELYKSDFLQKKTKPKKAKIQEENTDRRMVELYMTADIVLADYGSSVFSAIYMEKKLIYYKLKD